MAAHRKHRPKRTDRIVFRQSDNLGTAAAEHDQLLSTCFVDAGYLTQLADTSPASPCIVIGRTGSGKSALLLEFERRRGAIRLAPEELALSHISRSNIIGELAELGVKLDPFYKLLWRQFFCIHALTARFKSMSNLDRWFAKLQPRYRQAKTVLEEWAGKDFFKNSSTVSSQLVRTLEEKIAGELKAKGYSLKAGKDASFQRKDEIAPVCQDVITRDLAEQLQIIMTVTKRVLEDIDAPIYFVMDGLDEDWVQEDQRYLLIMGLIQTLSDMRGVPNSKVIAAIRRDLLEEVYVRARPAGFQEEKLQDMYLTIHYSRDDLVRILDGRINALLKDRYMKRAKVGYRDVFPDAIPQPGGAKHRTIEYLLSRTQMRPRDLITFANAIVRRSKNNSVTVARIREAEKKYSTERLKSIADEWHVQEPYLHHLARVVLRDQPSRFDVQSLAEEPIRDRAVRSAYNDADTNPLVSEFANGASTFPQFVEKAIQRLYRYGVVRLKPQPNERFRSGLDEDAPEQIEHVDSDTRVEVHPMFWQALNVREVADKQ